MTLPTFYDGEILEADALNQIVAEVDANRWHQTPLTNIGTFQPGSEPAEHSARYNDDWVWFMFYATITPGNVGLLFSFNSDYRPARRILVPLAAGNNPVLATLYTDGNLHAQYPVQTLNQGYRVSGMFPRA